jgi:hypothetical protein
MHCLALLRPQELSHRLSRSFACLAEGPPKVGADRQKILFNVQVEGWTNAGAQDSTAPPYLEAVGPGRSIFFTRDIFCLPQVAIASIMQRWFRGDRAKGGPYILSGVRNISEGTGDPLGHMVRTFQRSGRQITGCSCGAEWSLGRGAEIRFQRLEGSARTWMGAAQLEWRNSSVARGGSYVGSQS